jgi:hypothetical protein
VIDVDNVGDANQQATSPEEPGADFNDFGFIRCLSIADPANVARAQKRRFLRRIGLRASDLDGIGQALLDNWARAQAKVELLDRHFEQAGFLDADGEPRPASKVYFTAINSARLAAVRLAEHMKVARVGPDPLLILEGEGRRLRLLAEGKAEE